MLFFLPQQARDPLCQSNPQVQCTRTM